MSRSSCQMAKYPSFDLATFILSTLTAQNKSLLIIHC